MHFAELQGPQTWPDAERSSPIAVEDSVAACSTRSTPAWFVGCTGERPADATEEQLASSRPPDHGEQLTLTKPAIAARLGASASAAIRARWCPAAGDQAAARAAPAGGSA